MPSKRPAARLAVPEERRLNDAQHTLLATLRAGPRGKSTSLQGPFAAWVHAPAFGQPAQALGAYCRYKTALPRRLSEFAILCTARWWRAQYEWFFHAPVAERAGVRAQTIQDLRAGRALKSAPADERAIHAFVRELYKTKRVSAPTYKRVQRVLGDAAMVEFVGILGYYAMVSMTLNVFGMLPPKGSALTFAEPT